MTHASSSRVHQHNRYIRQPAHALIGDIDSQPRYVPTKFSHFQNLKKDCETSAAYRRQQSNTTVQLLMARLCQKDCEMDERAYEQVAWDVDSDAFMGYDGSYNYAGGLSDLVICRT
uniref:Uncharacterized protein n=1 Tax=Moniliophthora roreri TaxID=221103 RepID=A0A0W0G1K5_MONRR